MPVLLKWISTLMVVLLIAVGSTAGSTCDPNPDCSNSYHGDKVPDPLDCRAFFLCLADGTPSDVPIPCDEGTHFDSYWMECVYGTECSAICDFKCQITCNSTYDLIADYINCMYYYVCLPGGPQLMQCPSDRPYFNGEDCTTEKRLCCQPDCDAKCTTADVEIPDPYDCHSAYVCVNESNGFHFTCPDGCAFDPKQGHCDQNEPCNKSCSSLCAATTPVMSQLDVSVTEAVPSGDDDKETLVNKDRAMKQGQHE